MTSPRRVALRPAATPASGTPVAPDVGTATRVSLVALVTLLAVDGVRASGPLLDRAFTAGIVQVALAAALTYIGAGLLAGALLLGTGRRGAGTAGGRTVLVGVAALAVVRLVAQATQGQARVVVGLLAASLSIAVALLAVTLVAGRPAGGRQASVGVLLGAGLSTGLQLTLSTWDALWRTGVSGWLVTILVTGAALVLAWVARNQTASGRPRRTWVCGPALALVVMVLANPAFTAAQTGVSLASAGIALVLAAGAGVWLLLVPAAHVPGVRVAAAVALPVCLGVTFLAHGGWALGAIVLALPVTGLVLATALSTHRPAPRGLPRTVVATAGAGALLMATLLGYMVDYDVPLGFDNAWVVVACALLLSLGGLRWRAPQDTSPTPVVGSRSPLRTNAQRLLVLPGLVLALVGAWMVRTPAPATKPSAAPAASEADPLVVVDWNLHYGVAPRTAVDLEQVARTIEAQDPDVVTLQEVARGWVLGGGTDMATWLASRLEMSVEFAPAADRQFGNAILTRAPLVDPQVVELPYGAGPQQRSALTGRVELADGSWLRVTSVHLQHREANTPTRLNQLATLEAELPAATPALLAGDFNAEPGSPEIDLVTDEGWVSAIDTAGDAGALTSPTVAPDARIDWVLGQGVRFRSSTVLDDVSSDHFPVVTEVVAGD